MSNRRFTIIHKQELENEKNLARFKFLTNIMMKMNNNHKDLKSHYNSNMSLHQESINHNASRTSELNIELDKQKYFTKLLNNQLKALAAMSVIQSLIIVGLIISLSVLYTKKINVEIPINKLEFTEITGEEI